MSLAKVEGGWLVDSQPAGRGGKRFRKTFKTQAEAKTYQAWLTTQVIQDSKWQPEKRDVRKLSELIDIWYSNHGSGLRAGINTYSRLKLACEAMGNPVADRFTVEMFATYRTKRIADGISQNAVNREHAYLRAMFNELRRLGQWKKANPLAELRQFKIQEKELSHLTLPQINLVLASLANSRNRHAVNIAKVCLSTGARWSEAEDLKTSQVRNGMIQFSQTKSGKVRSVPISKELEASLLEHHDEKATGVRFFSYAASAFREAIERIKEINLPAGQMTHVLRHTFASHFMMRGGNILVLQKILGHANLVMTMRYAHLSPEHLQEAVQLNPLAAPITPLTLG